MKTLDLLTLQARHYELLTKEADKLGEEARQELLGMIEDHKKLLEVRDSFIYEQRIAAEGLFGKWEEEQNKNTKTPKNDDNTKDGDKEHDEKPDNNTKKSTGPKLLPAGPIYTHNLQSPKSNCSVCAGTMSPIRTTSKTIIVATPLLATETHVVEHTKCNCCGAKDSAGEPEALKNCIGRYNFSAIAPLAALHYQYGMPFNRLEGLSQNLGLPISSSTQWDLMESTANQVYGFYKFLCKSAANAPVQYCDDTSVSIIALVKEIREQQEQAASNGKSPNQVRSGVHTTNLTAKLNNGSICIFISGLHHSGEVLASFFEARTLEEQVIVMTDASSCNNAKIKKTNQDYELAHCNSHSIRKIKDHKEDPRVHRMLKLYREIFKNDQKTHSMPPKERLEFHKTNSLPLMEDIKSSIETAFAEKQIEPNSILGKDLQYFLNHYKELAAFCYIENAPIDNNTAERMLKGIIRYRKNSYFFKNDMGAKVADIFTTILFTAELNGIKSIEYLHHLLKYREHWKKSPEAWLPWNIQKTLDALHSAD